MPISEIARKLRIKPGSRIAIVSAPPGLDGLPPLSDGSRTTSIEDDPGLVLFFTKGSRGAEQVLPRVVTRKGDDTLLWWAYPKLSAKTGSDLSRYMCWSMARSPGFDAVSQISLDGTWTAPRLKMVEGPFPRARK